METVEKIMLNGSFLDSKQMLHHPTLPVFYIYIIDYYDGFLTHGEDGVTFSWRQLKGVLHTWAGILSIIIKN